MASAAFSAPVFRHRWRPWPFRADAEISGNKVQVFPPAGRGFTTLLRLGFGLRLPLQTCPQVGLVSAFCACPPTFALDFLHPRPHGRKLVLNFWVPPNWPRRDLHSRADVMSSVQEKDRQNLPVWIHIFFIARQCVAAPINPPTTAPTAAAPSATHPALPP